MAEEKVKLEFIKGWSSISKPDSFRSGFEYIVFGAPERVVEETAPFGKEVRHNGSGSLVMFFETEAERDAEILEHSKRIFNRMRGWFVEDGVAL